MRILIIYGTSEGHTAKVANFIAGTLRPRGYEVEMQNVKAKGAMPATSGFDAIIIGSSVHAGKYQAQVLGYVRDNLDVLRGSPSVFFSVSLTASRHDDEHRQLLKELEDGFVRETGWIPDRIWHVAGALVYRQYPALKRFLMKRVMQGEGGEADTSRNFEYTDWDALASDVNEFIENVLKRKAVLT